jgi:Abnormal spindle-like microcephaly-assoc'd, ASPM-SPD-2-Hydin
MTHLVRRLLALPVLIQLFAALPAFAQTFSGVLTWHNDNGRTGQNLQETTLAPANVNVNSFGKVFSFPVDGNIFAQPLYVPAVSIANQGTHNVVYVATENDSVYAFDADGLSTTPLWQVSFLNPPNIVPQPCTTANIGCVITPNVGITGTPVIDPVGQTLYVVSTTQESGTVIQRLHALDITSGAEKFGGPVQIQMTYPGTGSGSKKGIVTFNPAHQLQRPGLLLLNGVVYIAWVGTHGWLASYNATTLAQIAVFNSSPNSTNSGIWMSGAGPAADTQGNIYVVTADGAFDVNTGGVDYGDSVIKLNPSLQVVDYFTPMDQSCRSMHDQDLGSGGVMLLSSLPGPNPDEVFVGGKGGSPCDIFGTTYLDPFYVLNQNALGQYNPTQDQTIQTIYGPYTFVYGTAAFWNGPNNAYVYWSGFPRGLGGDYLRAFTLTNGLLSTTPVSLSKDRYPQGATPAVSANGGMNGIVWTFKRQDSLDNNPGPSPALLEAYDATNLAKLLYNSNQNAARDQAGPGTKFFPPTIANGRVYLGTQTELDVYGLLPVSLSPSTLSFVTRGVGVTSPVKAVTLQNTQTIALNISSITATGDFAQTSNCVPSVAANASCTINVTFTPTSSGTRTGTLTVNDDASLNTSTVALTGIGTFVKLSATTLPFGSVPVSQTSATKKITANNVGPSAVNFSNITVTGANAADFTQANTCTPSLAPGVSCTITITFTPSATGARSATITLTDDGAGSPQTIALSGTGT